MVDRSTLQLAGKYAIIRSMLKTMSLNRAFGWLEGIHAVCLVSLAHSRTLHIFVRQIDLCIQDRGEPVLELLPPDTLTTLWMRSNEVVFQ